MGSEFFTVGLHDQVTGPSKKMGSAATKLQAKLDRLGRKHDARGRFIAGSGSGGKGLLGSFGKADTGGISSMAGELKMLALAAGVAAAAITYKLGEAIIKTADLAGRSKLAFSAMLGGDDKADAQIDIAIAKSKKYGIAIEDIIEGQQQFMALGFNAGQANTMSDLVADMRFLGATDEKLKRVSLALSQIQGAGKLEGDEIRQLGEAGLPVGKLYQRIGENLGLVAKGGKSVVSQVKKLKEAGKIESDVALNSIAEVLLMTVNKSQLGQAGEEAAKKTVGGTLGRIGSLLSAGFFQVTREAEPALAKGFNAIFEGASKIDSSPFADKFSGVLQAIATTLETIGPKLPSIAENFMKAFNSASGFDPNSFRMFADSLPRMATTLGTIAGHMSTIAGHVMKIGQVWNLFNGDTSVRATDILGIDSQSLTGKLLNTSPSSAIDTVKDWMTGTSAPKLGPDVTPMDQMGAFSADAWQLFDQAGVTPMADSAMYGGSLLESYEASGKLPMNLRNYDAMSNAAADGIGDRSSKSITTGDIIVTIPISTAGSASEAAEHVQSKFEDEIGAHFDRLLQGAGG